VFFNSINKLVIENQSLFYFLIEFIKAILNHFLNSFSLMRGVCVKNNELKKIKELKELKNPGGGLLENFFYSFATFGWTSTTDNTRRYLLSKLIGCLLGSAGCKHLINSNQIDSFKE